MSEDSAPPPIQAHRVISPVTNHDHDNPAVAADPTTAVPPAPSGADPPVYDAPSAAEQSPNNIPAGYQFPGFLICPISTLPPVHPVTFMGGPQVFEQTHIWRLILSSGPNVIHPITRQQCPRVQAIGELRRVSVHYQRRILDERRRLEVEPGIEESPMTLSERASYLRGMGPHTIPPPLVHNDDNRPAQEPNLNNADAREDTSPGAEVLPPNNAEEDDFSSMLVCPITQEPPVRAVTFMSSSQVFEHSALYRAISTRGTLQAARCFFHPTTRESARRDQALVQVRDVAPEIQVVITEERRQRNLSEEDDNPLTQADRDTYNQTVAYVQNR